ncbi:MAG: hypothetical protein ABR992_06755 [Solirubrobacteraceae bacterium]|jgi:hypothetical protein
MFDSRNLAGRTVRTVLAVAAVAVAIPAQSQALAKSPKSIARPRSVMVDATTTLRGSGFPAKTVIKLAECGRTFWLVPSFPCLEREQAVTTNRHGRFRTTFTVGLCPEGEPGKMPTERTCYIGEPVAAEDTESLVGAVKITVSYP